MALSDVARLQLAGQHSYGNTWHTYERGLHLSCWCNAQVTCCVVLLFNNIERFLLDTFGEQFSEFFRNVESDIVEHYIFFLLWFSYLPFYQFLNFGVLTFTVSVMQSFHHYVSLCLHSVVDFWHMLFAFCVIIVFICWHCLFIFFVYFVSEHIYVFLALICTLRFSHLQLWFKFFVMSLTFWTRKELIWNIFWRFYCIYRLSCCFMWKVKVKLLKPVMAQCWKVEAVCAYKE